MHFLFYFRAVTMHSSLHTHVTLQPSFARCARRKAESGLCERTSSKHVSHARRSNIDAADGAAASGAARQLAARARQLTSLYRLCVIHDFSVPNDISS